MHNDLFAWLEQHEGREAELHDRHLNPAFAKMLRATGFDKKYVRGEGCYLWDEEGNKYLDLLTGWGVFALGRNHPKVKPVLQQMLSRDLPNIVRMSCGLLGGLAAEALTRHTPDGLSRVFFCNSGTETVEGAIKFARCFTGRAGIVYCDHAFHGLTAGALSLNGATYFRERFGDLLKDTERVPFNDLDALEKALSTRKHAAFIVEPLQGKTCELVADGYLLEAQRLCRKYGTLLIVDEVQSGLGRTGKWYCFQHFEGVEPDIICVSKALSGGYIPVGAIITRPKIMDCLYDSMERCVVHSNTFGENDMAMAAALATIHVIEEDKLVENAAEVGEYAISRLREMVPSCPFVSEVRGKGLMFGLAFERPEKSIKLKLAWDALYKMNANLFGQMIVIPLMRKHRILSQTAGFNTPVVKLLPPLIATKQDMDWLLAALDDVLADTLRVPGAAWETVTGLMRRTVGV